MKVTQRRTVKEGWKSHQVQGKEYSCPSCRPYGQTYDVARQLAGCASWGGMLVSEHVWEEQGPHARLWVYNQGVSMPWGPVISCFALLPEGHAAYLHSNALPTLVTRGMPLL